MNESQAGAPSLTQCVAQFIRETNYGTIPNDVQELGKKSILDGLGVALSGSISAPGRIVRDYVREFGSGKSTVIGSDLRLPSRFAAFANGTAMHADDYDDTLQAETGRYQGVHVTAPVLSAVLAAAEQRDTSGRALLTAYQVGVEVACRIFDATDPNHVLHGFHSTGTCGMLGATAGVSRLIDADVERARLALGLAGSQAGALLENIGSMAKPFHAGRAAEGAIVANELVARGFTASPSILEAPGGFFMAQGGGHEDARLRWRLGNPWSFVDRGVWLKPFPSCSLGHPALTRMRELVAEHDLKPEEIARIRVRTSENMRETLRQHAPTNELLAKFSMEFCLAAILNEGRCGLNQFNETLVNDPDTRRTMGLIDYTAFAQEEARANGHTLVTTTLEIDLKDGRTIASRVDYGKGSKANPMSMEEVADKVRECAQYAHWPEAKAEQVITLVQRLESLASVRELTKLLAP